MKYKNIFFDLDGTLTDSGEGIMNSGRYAFEQLGLQAPTIEELRKMVGPPLGTSFALLGIPETQIEEAIRLYRDNYNNRGGKYQNQVYSGIEGVLKDLKKQGFKLYVATSKPEILAREILEGFQLAQYFEYIAGATLDHSRETKADVLKYLLTAGDCKESSIMVGDTAFDVIGSHELGIPCIGVTWGYGTKDELENAEADFIAISTDELYDFIFR